MKETIGFTKKEAEDYMNSPRGVVIDAENQFFQFMFWERTNGIDAVKKLIVETSNDKDNSLKTLEDYIIHKDYYKEDPAIVIEKIKKFEPTVFEKYNNLIERLKSLTLTKEEFLQILEEAKKLI